MGVFNAHAGSLRHKLAGVGTPGKSSRPLEWRTSDCQGCQMLVEAGANTEARDRLHRTPAGLAKEFGFVNLLNFLEHRE